MYISSIDHCKNNMNSLSSVMQELSSLYASIDDNSQLKLLDKDIKKLSKLTIKILTKHDISSPIISHLDKAHKQSFSCEICGKVGLNEYTLKKHNESRAHMKKTGEIETKPAQIYDCTLCHKTGLNQHNYQQHIGSSYHKMMENMPNYDYLTVNPDQSIFCHCCDVLFVYHPKNDHFKQKRHLKNFNKWKQLDMIKKFINDNIESGQISNDQRGYIQTKITQK